MMLESIIEKVESDEFQQGKTSMDVLRLNTEEFGKRNKPSSPSKLFTLGMDFRRSTLDLFVFVFVLFFCKY